MNTLLLCCSTSHLCAILSRSNPMKSQQDTLKFVVTKPKTSSGINTVFQDSVFLFALPPVIWTSYLVIKSFLLACPWGITRWLNIDDSSYFSSINSQAAVASSAVIYNYLLYMVTQLHTSTFKMTSKQQWYYSCWIRQGEHGTVAKNTLKNPLRNLSRVNWILLHRFGKQLNRMLQKDSQSLFYFSCAIKW